MSCRQNSIFFSSLAQIRDAKSTACALLSGIDSIVVNVSSGEVSALGREVTMNELLGYFALNFWIASAVSFAKELFTSSNPSNRNRYFPSCRLYSNWSLGRSTLKSSIQEYIKSNIESSPDSWIPIRRSSIKTGTYLSYSAVSRNRYLVSIDFPTPPVPRIRRFLLIWSNESTLEVSISSPLWFNPICT